MKYNLRSMMAITAGGTIAGWWVAELIRESLMSRQVSFPPGVGAIFMAALFGGGMIAGGVAGAWLATRLKKAAP